MFIRIKTDDPQVFIYLTGLRYNDLNSGEIVQSVILDHKFGVFQSMQFLKEEGYDYLVTAETVLNNPTRFELVIPESEDREIYLQYKAVIDFQTTLALQGMLTVRLDMEFSQYLTELRRGRYQTLTTK